MMIEKDPGSGGKIGRDDAVWECGMRDAALWALWVWWVIRGGG